MVLVTGLSILNIDEKLAYSPEELSKVLSISVQSLTKDRSLGHIGIPFVKMGHRVVYPVDKVREWLSNSAKSPSQFQAQLVKTNSVELKRSKGRPKGTTKAELAKRRFQ